MSDALPTRTGPHGLPSVIGVSAVAEWLAVPEATVRAWAYAGTLPGFKAGKAWRFSVRELERWLEEREGGRRSRAAKHAGAPHQLRRRHR